MNDRELQDTLTIMRERISVLEYALQELVSYVDYQRLELIHLKTDYGD